MHLQMHLRKRWKYAVTMRREVGEQEMELEPAAFEGRVKELPEYVRGQEMRSEVEENCEVFKGFLGMSEGFK